MTLEPRKPSGPPSWVRTAGDVSIIPTMIGVGAAFGYAIGHWGFAPFFPQHREAAIGVGVLLGLASAFRESYKILKRYARERPAKGSAAKPAKAPAGSSASKSLGAPENDDPKPS